MYLRIMKKLREIQLNQRMTPAEQVAGEMIDELLASEWVQSFLKADDERNQAV